MYSSIAIIAGICGLIHPTLITAIDNVPNRLITSTVTKMSPGPPPSHTPKVVIVTSTTVISTWQNPEFGVNYDMKKCKKCYAALEQLPYPGKPAGPCFGFNKKGGLDYCTCAQKWCDPEWNIPKMTKKRYHVDQCNLCISPDDGTPEGFCWKNGHEFAIANCYCPEQKCDPTWHWYHGERQWWELGGTPPRVEEK